MQVGFHKLPRRNSNLVVILINRDAATAQQVVDQSDSLE